MLNVSERLPALVNNKFSSRWENIRKNGRDPGRETGRDTGATAGRKEEKEVEREIGLGPGPGPMRERNIRRERGTTRGGGGQYQITDTRRARGGLADIPPVIQGQTPTPSAPTTPLYSLPSWS